MKSYIALMLVSLFFSCGTPPQKSNTVVIGKTDTTVVEPDSPKVVVIELTIPDGAATANYRTGVKSFYGYVKNVNVVKAITIIAFEDNSAPSFAIKDSYGAKLSHLRFSEFDRDLLLVTSEIKDPNFNKYYLFILQDNQWKEVVNGWAIHKNNQPDTLKPIQVDSKNPNRMHRYYSVFDLDKESELGYTWRLLEERIPIENK